MRTVVRRHPRPSPPWPGAYAFKTITASPSPAFSTVAGPLTAPAAMLPHHLRPPPYVGLPRLYTPPPAPAPRLGYAPLWPGGPPQAALVHLHASGAAPLSLEGTGNCVYGVAVRVGKGAQAALQPGDAYDPGFGASAHQAAMTAFEQRLQQHGFDPAACFSNCSSVGFGTPADSLIYMPRSSPAGIGARDRLLNEVRNLTVGIAPAPGRPKVDVAMPVEPHRLCVVAHNAKIVVKNVPPHLAVRGLGQALLTCAGIDASAATVVSESLARSGHLVSLIPRADAACIFVNVSGMSLADFAAAVPKGFGFCESGVRVEVRLLDAPPSTEGVGAPRTADAAGHYWRPSAERHTGNLVHSPAGPQAVTTASPPLAHAAAAPPASPTPSALNPAPPLPRAASPPPRPAPAPTAAPRAAPCPAPQPAAPAPGPSGTRGRAPAVSQGGMSDASMASLASGSSYGAGPGKLPAAYACGRHQFQVFLDNQGHRWASDAAARAVPAPSRGRGGLPPPPAAPPFVATDPTGEALANSFQDLGDDPTVSIFTSSPGEAGELLRAFERFFASTWTKPDGLGDLRRSLLACARDAQDCLLRYTPSLHPRQRDPSTSAAAATSSGRPVRGRGPSSATPPPGLRSSAATPNDRRQRQRRGRGSTAGASLPDPDTLMTDAATGKARRPRTGAPGRR